MPEPTCNRNEVHNALARDIGVGFSADRDGLPAARLARPAPMSVGVRPRILRWDAPLLPPQLYAAGATRATLMVLTGKRAGELVSVGGRGLVIGTAADADLVVDEPGVSGHHVLILRTADGRFSIQDLASTKGTFIGSRRIGFSLLADRDPVQLGPHLHMRFAMIDTTEEWLHRRLYEASVRDPLTHVFNRTFLANRLDAEIAHARRTNGHVAVLMVDLDRLKHVNDRFGHLAGDRALCLVASRLFRVVRAEDVLARYGGDEFVILCRTTERAEVRLLAERARSAIEALPIAARGQSARMTVSVGGASLGEVEPSDEPVAALLALADERMYRAKSSGGNCHRTT
jgi:two-component system cell cycle response regulator